MKTLPPYDQPAVLRTDFSDDAAWKKLCTAIKNPVGEFQAFVDFVDDPAFDKITPQNLIERLGENHPHTFIILADQTTFASPERTLLIIDLFDNPGRTFRALPTTIQSIENNLSIANMGFEDFADNVDEKGVFRGFEKA